MAYTDIDKPDDYFNTKLYTGTGATHNITGVGFQPDWVWIKRRNTLRDHSLFDSVRGVQKQLASNQSDAESSSANYLTSFDTDGFTVGSSSNVNASSDTYASWNWLAGGTASSNTDGSITSSVSANTTSRFSIVSWTGSGATATVGHGLDIAPSMIIIKNRDETQSWIVGITSNVFTWSSDYLRLNLIDAKRTDGGGTLFSSAPTSSLINVGSNTATNGSSDNMIAYCFAEKKGYSKFGSYTGNGSTDGTFIYTGFKHAFFMAKKTSGTSAWIIHDNKRNVDNPIGKALFANSSDAEYDYSGDGTPIVDFVSGGFKYRGTASGMNASGGSYIYMAFAENPFVTSTGIPCTAR